jgi:hypothetical protein
MKIEIFKDPPTYVFGYLFQPEIERIQAIQVKKSKYGELF